MGGAGRADEAQLQQIRDQTNAEAQRAAQLDALGLKLVDQSEARSTSIGSVRERERRSRPRSSDSTEGKREKLELGQEEPHNRTKGWIESIQLVGCMYVYMYI